MIVPGEVRNGKEREYIYKKPERDPGTIEITRLKGVFFSRVKKLQETEDKMKGVYYLNIGTRHVIPVVIEVHR